MAISENAREQLEAMRSLMDRAAIYRAISAPLALGAGLLTVLVSMGMIWYFGRYPGLTPTIFVLAWVAVLGAVLFAGGLVLFRGARHRGEAFVSPRMRFAFAQVLPSALAAASITFWHWLMIYQIAPVVFYWMVFYGLALLSMDEYAPRAIVVLGWCFLLAGLLTAPVFYLGLERFGAGPVDGAYAMGCTFGLFHIVFAICVWPRRRRDPATAA
ncbi:MAG: hypothetical protein IT577_02430 [Verrucomicrobiae bacterium]|nr:hypothetical protein [Verrucomicrobiae bacterium]